MRIFTLLFLLTSAAVLRAEEPVFPKFKVQEIATDLTVGYAVITADVNGDGKPDIVVVDSKRVVWYENPTWKVRPLITGKTKPDNVCITALDIDGDGQIDFVVGADWAPFNTKSGGTLQWLKRGKTLDEEWSIHPISEEPTVHRVRTADIDGSGKKTIVLVPLMGRESTKEANWMDGRPVRVLAYPTPKDPVKGPWVPVVLNENLHVCHNFWPLPTAKGKADDILVTAYEGVFQLHHDGKNWTADKKGAGNQSNLKGNRGASEIKIGTLKENQKYVATVEPWHGNEIVVYPVGSENKDGLWQRVVIDNQLRWGHGVWCADLDGDGDEELVIGVRDNPGKGDTFKEQCGVRIYKAIDKTRTKWVRHILDDGGVAVEDLTVADLNGDGKPDIVAVGRKTQNARIYWNQGK
ncbi:MAG: VCBS repeat-containing protein [Planctomycetes bacterium]|nr:VCBS repeat-containing protein [Planctomycetota bacterium]